MQTENAPLPSDPVRIVLDICRRVTLLQPLAARFDAIPMMSPIERVKAAATVVIEAAETNEFIRDRITSSGCMGAFKELAGQRAAGGIELPQLKPDLPGGQDKMRESN